MHMLNGNNCYAPNKDLKFRGCYCNIRVEKSHNSHIGIVIKIILNIEGDYKSYN